MGCFQRYAQFREERKKKPHAPGVWVVYFSFAALPLFGLGQAQIPPEEESRRSYAFQLMCIYVGSGLGLLLTTSFLGLRRYLRQRKLRMPAGITTTWLILGAFLIFLVLIFGALLPQPGASHPLLDWTGIGSRKRDTSPLAQVGKGNKPAKDDQGAKTKGKEKDDSEKGKEADKKSAASSTGKGKEQGNNKGQGDNEKKDQKSQGKKDKGDKENGSGGKNREKDKEADKSGTRREKAQAPPTNSVGSFFNKLAGILKWIVMGVLILAILFVILRSGLRWLANFTLWAQRLLAALSAWWQSLGNLFKRTATAQEKTIPEEKPLPPRPFSAYPDPFLYGDGESMSAANLVRYSFEALEAWARERDLGRSNQETPLEFAQRLGGEFLDLDKDVRRLAGYYAGLAYAGKSPPASCREAVRVFWQKLVDVVEKHQPV